ncbi:MAG: DUF2232 domain-containing protein [Thermosynechococcaceae cyanobacterium]
MPEPLPSSELDDFISTPREPAPNSRHLITGPLVMVETAFLASTTALIWLINFYVPTGPLLRMFFPVPVALAYLRWGRRAAWMTAMVTSLLVAVLLGPPRSLQFLIPYGFLGVLLGGLWRRRAGWYLSMGWGVLVMAAGLFFQVGFLSLLLGTNLWLYLNRQVLGLLDWIFLKLGVLIEPDLVVVQLFAVGLLFVNAALYVLLVHLVSWLLLERLDSPIPNPPRWLQILLDYQEE